MSVTVHYTQQQSRFVCTSAGVDPAVSQEVFATSNIAEIELVACVNHFFLFISNENTKSPIS